MIDSHEIKIIGGANIEHSEGDKLELKHDYTIGAIVNCSEIAIKDNQDGTERRVYKMKLTGGLLISGDWGEKPIKAKGKGSPSQKMRNALYYKHTELGVEEDFETWYERKVSEIIVKLDNII